MKGPPLLPERVASLAGREGVGGGLLVARRRLLQHRLLLLRQARVDVHVGAVSVLRLFDVHLDVLLGRVRLGPLLDLDESMDERYCDRSPIINWWLMLRTLFSQINNYI